MSEILHQSILSDTELRLKCLEFVVQKSNSYSYNWPNYQLVETEIIFKYIKEGRLPDHAVDFANGKTMIDYSNGEIVADRLLERAFKLLMQERKQCNQPAQSSDKNTDNLKQPKSRFSNLLGRFRRK